MPIRHVDRQGYVEIDHRESPGITQEEAFKVGSKIAVGKGQRFQAGTRKCCGCEARIIFLKKEAQTQNYCSQCDAFMCDRCLLIKKVTGRHKPFIQIMEEFFRKAAMSG